MVVIRFLSVIVVATAVVVVPAIPPSGIRPRFGGHTIVSPLKASKRIV